MVLFAAVFAAILAEAMYRLSPTYAAVLVIAPVVLGVIVWRPLWGVYASLLAIPLESVGTSIASANVTPAKGLLVITALSIIPRLVLSSDRRLHVTHVWFLLLLVVSISGLFFAPDTHAVLVITANAFAYLVISIFVSRLDKPDIERLLLVLVISGGIVGLVTIASSSVTANATAATSDAARAELGFDSPNVLAFYLLLALGPSLALIAAGGDVWRRLVGLGATPLIVVALVLTQSRTAILGAVLVVFVLLGSSRFRRLAAALAAVLLIVVAFNFGAILRSPQLGAVQQRLTAIDSVAGVSQDPRVLIWKTTPSIIAAHPWLGVGEGNFPVISPSYGLYAFDLTPIDHAHDVFLTVAAELGLIGFAVFMAFLYTFVRATWRTLRRLGSSELLFLGVAASFTGVLLSCLGDYPPRTPDILAVLMLMVGVVLAYERYARLRSAS
jgi:putative inorganic carbon (hco3(-)) transporter